MSTKDPCKKKNLLDELKELLSHDIRLTVDGKLLKNKVVESGLKLDPALLRMLLSHQALKECFFQDVEGITVFDKIKFQKFVSNKEFLPNSYSAFKNKIGLTSEDTFLSEAGEVVLSWTGKDCVLEGGQTKEESSREEILWNKVLAPDEIDRLFKPKVLANFKRCDINGMNGVKELSITDNLIIKGNNLLALHSIRPIYAGMVKLVYLDPPYNRGKDDSGSIDGFGYNDSFNHSSWLTFMKNRLEVARDLLRPDGCILIQIDNNEVAYLKIVCDEIFGRTNYRNSIIVKKGTKSLQKQFTEIQKLSAGFDTILLYTKTDTVKLPNLFKELKGATSSDWNNHWRGTDRPTMRFELFGITPKTGQWRWEKYRTAIAVDNYKKLCDFIRKFEGQNAELTDALVDIYYEKYITENGILDTSEFELVRLSKNGNPEHYIPPRIEILLSENWMDLNVSGNVTDFDHEKNEEILKRIIKWLTKEDDLIVDFFAGSGTTAAVALKMNRRFITCEQMNYCEPLTVERLKKVIDGEQGGISEEVQWKGGGSFVYCELAKQNQNFVARIEAATEGQTDKLFSELLSNPHATYLLNLKTFKESIRGFKDLSLSDKKKVLLSMLDYNQLYINLSEINDTTLEISDDDKRLNNIFYNIK